MAGVQFILRSVGSFKSDDLVDRITDLSVPMQEIGKEMKRVIMSEFQGKKWESPTGPRPWPKRKPWGATRLRRLNNPPLGPAATAWRYARVHATKRQVLVTPAGGDRTNKIIAFHRGGTGGASSLVDSRVFRSKGGDSESAVAQVGMSSGNAWHRHAMGRVNMRRFGLLITVRRGKRGFNVPTRKHATNSRVVVNRGREIIERHIEREANRA